MTGSGSPGRTPARSAVGAESTTAYLVRVGGLRDPDLSKMRLEELDQQSKQQAMIDRMMFQRGQLTSKEYLQSRYGLDLQVWHNAPQGS